MAAPVVCDTDALIDYFAGSGPLAPAVRGLLETGALAVTTITLFELACGARTPDKQADIRRLAGTARVLDVTPSAAWEAARVWRGLRDTGRPLNTADVLIAGCCLAEGLSLLTRNAEHFSRVPGLLLATA
ncbi:MAG TPA: type II toxin-antitoxin system VapC family toxin [bacterium]|nr:type II toxin-antitoxin system VapC family toxin [bacterium]